MCGRDNGLPDTGQLHPRGVVQYDPAVQHLRDRCRDGRGVSAAQHKVCQPVVYFFGSADRLVRASRLGQQLRVVNGNRRVVGER
jgi:hypothetical protein